MSSGRLHSLLTGAEPLCGSWSRSRRSCRWQRRSSSPSHRCRSAMPCSPVCWVCYGGLAVNAIRLQLHAPAYSLSNFLRTLVTSELITDWSLTSLREKLIKIGAKVINHGRHFTLQMAEVAIPRRLVAGIPQLIAKLRPPPDPSPA